MAESIVRSPKEKADMDFLAFSFDGKHSYDDFGLWRTSDGDRYNENLTPTITDKTAEAPGSDGMYYFNTNYKQKDFSINFAFERLTEDQLREMKKWLAGKKMGELWFEEAPYKVYMVKVTGQPSIKSLCFNDNGERVYKGDGTVQFTAYWPYGHTPDKIVKWSESNNEYEKAGSGKDFSSYENFATAGQWRATSGLIENPDKLCMGENPGDIPAHFQLTIKDRELTAGTKIVVGDASIILEANTVGLTWDTKTGLVHGKVRNEDESEQLLDKLIGYSGTGGLCKIPVDGLNTDEIYYEIITKDNNITTVTRYYINGQYTQTVNDGNPTNGTHNTLSLNYHYWYY